MSLSLVACGDDSGTNANDNGNGNGNESSLCGDGVMNGAEECDDGAQNSDAAPDACRTDCRRARCGDGVVDTGEVCDDGPSNSDEVPGACRSDCSEPRCGDGVVDVGLGETCDCGGDEAHLALGCTVVNGGDGASCRADCRVSFCGNGVLDASEMCDDGNFRSGDGCSADCLSDETCGNGYVDTVRGEECDDGNQSGADGCQPDCRWPRCGDGRLDSGEECDDGNLQSGDGCQANCLLPQCGDGILDPGQGETCDDGNLDAGDGCSPSCLREYCGNGVLDASEVCDDGDNLSGDGCNASCSSMEVCGNGIVDLVSPTGGEQCDDGGTEDGDGCSATCHLEVCGNGFVDTAAHEVCDDGNNRSGDGCSADCRSDETCRNGYVDFQAGEQCDDGNALSHDGCSSGCTGEVPTWTQWADAMGRVEELSMVYDASRQRLVAFGGSGDCGPFCSVTWEYDGSRWQVVDTPHVPPGRHRAAMAYDSDSHRVLLFGGDSASPLGDLWAYDGADWTAVSNTNPPPARGGAKMVYNPDRQVFLLFGGHQDENGTLLNDTWEYSPASGAWRQLAAGTGPAPRDCFGMVYDTARHGVLMVGGNDEPVGQAGQEQWGLDGTVADPVWVQLPTQSPPLGRACMSMAYDPDRQVTVLFGGWGNCSGSECQDTWELDGAAVWHEVAGIQTPPDGRARAAMAYFGRDHVMVLFGGEGAANRILGDTWGLDGGQWLDLSARMMPGRRERAAMVQDPVRGDLLLFGGSDGDTSHLPEPTMWRFRDQQWTPLPCTTDGTTPGVPGVDCPLPRLGHRMVWDVDREVVVLFGGLTGWGGSTTLFGDTWEFDPASATWQEISATPSPSPRALFGMAYDTQAHRAVLFGGVPGDVPGAGAFGDTWEYDGATSTWLETTPTPSPPARSFTQMTFDASNLVSVLVGGVDDSMVQMEDTWIYGGGQWIDVTPAEVPPVRVGTTFVYDTARRRGVLFGGLDLAGNRNDLWEWDGATWTRVYTNAPSPRAFLSAAWDGLRRRIGYYGGSNPDALDELYFLQYGSQWPDEVCDNGADDDGDDAIDCGDPDCDGRTCGPGQICVGGACI